MAETELRVDDAPVGLADGDHIARAEEYPSSVSGAIGFAAGEPVEFESDPKLTSTSGGMQVVSLRQTLNGRCGCTRTARSTGPSVTR
ncbi:hypothetical protein ACWCPF_34765 [Streptomyces sp. NPDC001858]